MSQSPTIEGFRTLFRRPLLGLAEISWRWIFGAAASSLVGFWILEYLDTLPVSATDRFLLGTQSPSLVGRALAHIFHGSAPRFVAAGVILGLTLALAWIAVASWGRAVTLKNLLAYLRPEEAEDSPPFRFRSLAGLNFLRVGAAVAVVVGSIGALVLADLASPDKDPSPGAALLVFGMVIMLVWLAWSAVNWFLSLAAVFVVRQGDDTFGALGSAADICRSRTGAILAAGSWFGLAHMVAFFGASFVVGLPLAFAGLVPPGFVLIGVLLVTLAYFAVADWLYMGRLAAYVWIVEHPEPEPVSPVVAPPVAPEPSSAVDPDELILSDLPVS